MSGEFMIGLDRLEQAVLDKLLAGDHPVLVALREQATSARLARREYTGVGFHCHFDVGEGAPTVKKDFHIGDVRAEMEGVAHGIGFVLIIRDGRLSMLEGYTYDEPWPSEIRGFTLRYAEAGRRSELAKLG